MDEGSRIARKSIIIAMVVFFIIALGPCISSAYHKSFPVVSTSEPYHYFTYQEMTELLYDLADQYPDIVHLESIGTTYEGRSIWMVKLSDNAAVDEDEPGVLLMGAHHGNEKPSYEVVLFFIQYIVHNYYENTTLSTNKVIQEDQLQENYEDSHGILHEDLSDDRVRAVMNNTQIYCIPMVNPDGVEANTRKNRAPNYGPDGTSNEITSYGVDLNRNYGFRWFLPFILKEYYYFTWLTDDQSDIYRGERAFSEAETKSVKDFVETKNISISLSYHDFGEWMIFPWTHSSLKTTHERLYRSIGENMSLINNYELKIYGQYGTKEYLIPRFCGTVGTSENWLYAQRNILAFTIELCPFRAPRNADLVYDACNRQVGVNLYICERSWTVEQEKKDHFNLQ